MAHAERCPICYGTGKLTPPKIPYYTSDSPQPQTCHGCGGLGWVTVQDPRPFLESPTKKEVKDGT